MKLRIQEVRESGPVDLEESVPAEAMPLAAPLVAPVHLTVHAESLGDEVLALIKAEARVGLECARCLVRFEKPLLAKVQLHVPAGDAEVEIAEEARQSLDLALPVKPLCRPDCRGLCPRCGKNLNEGPCACAGERPGTPFEALKKLKLS
jgi:uncharacterized protein